MVALEQRARHRTNRVARALRVAGAAVLCAAVLLAAACREEVSGSGQGITEQRDVGSFTELRVHGAITAEVRIGQPQSVAISGDDNVVRVIRTEVRDGRLTIEPEKSYNSDEPLRASIVVPELESVEASGASTVTLSGVNAQEFRARASGASTVRASGSVERVEADASGASRIRFEDLTAREAEADASGASTVEVSASERVSGSASGASTVTYSGRPQVNVRTSGASSVRGR